MRSRDMWGVSRAVSVKWVRERVKRVLSNRWRRRVSASPMIVWIVLVGILWKGKVETKLVEKGGGHAVEEKDRAVDVANDDYIAVGRR